jgi:hypothetical protein
MTRTARVRTFDLLPLLAFALLTTAVLALYMRHFDGRPYRQDEAWLVHGALLRDLPQMVQWVAVNIHPPLWTLLADVWVGLVGQSESLVRGLSWLFTALTLAFTYRLAADLFTRQVGLLAVFVTGVSSFFAFYTSEFRPYPLMTTLVVALLLCFLRWLRRPTFAHAALVVAAGVGALYTHFFSIYALAALAVFFIAFVHWQPGLYLRAVGLFAAVGLSYLGWLLPFVHALLVATEGGINYALSSEWWTVQQLYPRMTFQPRAIGEFLALTALLGGWLARRRHHQPDLSQQFRFDPQWRLMYPFTVALLILALAYVVNIYVPNLTKRSLIILFPLAAVVLAYGMALLPRAAQAVLIVMLIVPALTFTDHEFTGQHALVARFMAGDYRAGDPIIVNVPTLSQQIAVLYYVQERMPIRVGSEDLLRVLVPRQPYLDFAPTPLLNPVYSLSDEALARLGMFIAGAEQVWYIEREGGNLFTEPFLQVIAAQYVEVDRLMMQDEYTVIQFRRRAVGES